jgi:hypothetical protein
MFGVFACAEELQAKVLCLALDASSQNEDEQFPELGEESKPT